eukprot:Skav202101  [mRNA]  locus=scaffold1980:44529:45428:- [translate_table: standard]
MRLNLCKNAVLSPSKRCMKKAAGITPLRPLLGRSSRRFLHRLRCAAKQRGKASSRRLRQASGSNAFDEAAATMKRSACSVANRADWSGSIRWVKNSMLNNSLLR